MPADGPVGPSRRAAGAVNGDVAGALTEAARRIGGASGRLDAELLLAHAKGVSREDLLLGRAGAIDMGVFEALVARRVAGAPVAYLTGRREFWSLDLMVSPAVLIPRPDSETLIAAAVERVARGAAPRVLDLGTGSGALLLAALVEWPGAWGVGVDRSAAAVAVAQANAHALRLAGRAAFLVGDWGTALGAGGFDLVFANPPYVADGEVLAGDVLAEPEAALFAGADGLAAYRALLPDLGRLLAAGGTAIVEIGHTQAAAVAALAAGFDAEVKRDLGGHARALVLTSAT